MNISGFLAVPALLALCALPALAQDGVQGLDQYPSFIQFSASNNDGTQSVLRCGYSANGKTVTLDPSFREISVMNQQRHSYSRIQKIDNDYIATSADPAGGPGLILELVQPSGVAKAKNCQTDDSTDTIHDCRTISPFTFVDQIKSGDEKVGAQCEALLKQAAAQINPATADPQKTETFKATLRQKVDTLSAP